MVPNDRLSTPSEAAVKMVAGQVPMDDKDFKKHLKDLVEGHHHPEEHDWASPEARAGAAKPAKAKTSNSTKARKKTAPAARKKRTRGSHGPKASGAGKGAA